jgi:hypothetical protein
MSATSTIGEVERAIHSAGTTRRSHHSPPCSIIKPMGARSRSVIRKPDEAVAIRSHLHRDFGSTGSVAPGMAGGLDDGIEGVPRSHTFQDHWRIG